MVLTTSISFQVVLTTILVLSTSTLATPVPGFQKRDTVPSAPSAPAAPAAPVVSPPTNPTLATHNTPTVPSVDVNSVPVTPVDPSGTVSVNTGVSDIVGCNPGFAGLLCTPCQPGTFSAGGSAATCTPCAAGSFSTSTTAAQCTLCPASTYNDKTGSSTSSSCVACPTGSVSKIGSASFAACATGYHVLVINTNGYSNGYLANYEITYYNAIAITNTLTQALTIKLPKTLDPTLMPVTLIATQTLGTHGPALAFGQFGYGSTGGFLTQGTDDEKPDESGSSTDMPYYGSVGETDIFVLGAYDPVKNQIPISLQINDSYNSKDTEAQFYDFGQGLYITGGNNGNQVTTCYLIPV